MRGVSRRSDPERRVARVASRGELVDAKEAAALLGVRVATVYAYASRGRLRGISPPGSRGRRYAREEVLRVKALSDARAGHGAVAAGALRWGEPVLESALTRIEPTGPTYRGRLASEFIGGERAFERAAEWLWAGSAPAEVPWKASDAGIDTRQFTEAVPRDAGFLDALGLALPLLALADPARFDAPAEAEITRARGLVVRLVASVAAVRARPGAVARVLRASSVAEATCHALGVAASPASVAAVDAALVAVADHELNASTFAARVAASAGADLYACLSAGLATLGGTRHGGASARVEYLIDEVEVAREAGRGVEHVVNERARRGDSLPGFGHPLYPAGDPRFAWLERAADAVGVGHQRAAATARLVRAVRRTRGTEPNLDAGLVLLASALGAPRGAGSVLFAFGRVAGWVAHVLEQRAAGHLLRPRARYVGVAPGTGGSGA